MVLKNVLIIPTYAEEQNKKAIEWHIANQSKTNPKEFYSYIRQKWVLNSTIRPLVDEKGEFTRDEERMSNVLHKFLTSVFTRENLNDMLAKPIQSGNNKTLNMISITERDVARCFDKLKVNTMHRSDKISPWILKKVKNKLFKPFTVLFNYSLKAGTVPDMGNLANKHQSLKNAAKLYLLAYRQCFAKC